MNHIGNRQSQAEEREERERIERVANEREQQAQEERREISSNIKNLVTLARERDPGLTEQEAIRTITTEVSTLRERTSQFERELEGLRRHSKVAKYNALGLTGIAGVGLTENSPINQALEGAYVQKETQSGTKLYPRCDALGMSRFENVAREFPNFPFSYWALALCLKKMGNSKWRAFAKRALSIFQYTTQIGERSSQHDQAHKEIEELLAE